MRPLFGVLHYIPLPLCRCFQYLDEISKPRLRCFASESNDVLLANSVMAYRSSVRLVY